MPFDRAGLRRFGRKWGIFAIVLLALYAVYRLTPLSKISVWQIEYWLREHPHRAWLYVGTFVAVAVVPFPENLLVIAAGRIFPMREGFWLTVAASSLSSALAFGVTYLGMRVGRRKEVREIERIRSARVHSKVRVWGDFLTTLFLRLVPIFPYKAVSYSCALMEISFVPYMAGTVLGTMPGIYAFLYLGDQTFRGEKRGIALAVLALVLLAAMGGIAKMVYAKRRRGSDDGEGIRQA